MNDLMNNQQSMSSLEIAELTGKQHDNVLRDIRKMLKELERAALKFEGSYKDASGKENVLFNLDKELTITLVSGYNVKMRHAIVKRWQELESQQIQPAHTQITAGTASDAMQAMEIAARMLRLSESSKLGLVHSVYDKYNLPTKALPAYAVDARSQSTTGSADVTFSATSLLKEFGSELSARQFNLLARECGFLEQLERPSTSSPTGIKRYWSITPAGRRYGKNVVSPGNPRETQPHWFRESFDDLLLEMEMDF